MTYNVLSGTLSFYTTTTTTTTTSCRQLKEVTMHDKWVIYVVISFIIIMTLYT